MLSDYISKEAVSQMTFEEFKGRWDCNIEIIRHKLTMKQAFKELGGVTIKEPKKKFKKFSSEDK